MSDVHCAVCGEPWDTYHLREDAPPWVLPLFRAGLGCESCEGVRPEGGDAGSAMEQHLRDRVLGVAFDDDVDPVGDAVNHVARDLSPRRQPTRWQRPNDTVVWECECCGIKRMHNVDFRGSEEDYFELTSEQRQMYHWDDPDDAPEAFGGKTCCSKCLTWCDECGERMLLEDSVIDWENDVYGQKPMHEDCCSKRRDEKHLEWVESEVQRILYARGGDLVDPSGLDVDPGNVATDVVDKFDWHPGERSPEDDDIFDFINQSGWFTPDDHEE
jgi:hypothetical protein